MIIPETPLAIGAIDPPATSGYDRIKATVLSWRDVYNDDGTYDRTVAEFSWYWGYWNGSKFVRGVLKASGPVMLDGDDFTAVFGVAGDSGEVLKDHCARALYEWMVTNVSECENGTVEEALP